MLFDANIFFDCCRSYLLPKMCGEDKCLVHEDEGKKVTVFLPPFCAENDEQVYASENGMGNSMTHAFLLIHCH